MTWRAGERIHFMGIGGIGVSALAELARARGAVVDGCDREDGERVAWLRARGVPVFVGHDAVHVRDVDRLVFTRAVAEDQPERVAAGGRAMSRGEALAGCMSARRNVGVAGAHGKTTTTALLAQLLRSLDPTVFVGGVVSALEGGNVRIGADGGDDLFVAELDESDGSFLLPDLALGLVTSVDPDHLAYYGDADAYHRAFVAFADRMRPEACLFVGADDPGARALADGRPRKRVIRCGAGNDNDWQWSDRVPVAGGQQFRIRADAWDGDAPLFLPLSGEHNVKNALLAVAAARTLGVEPVAIREALARVVGPGRRMERVGAVDGVPVYADYAHHPAEAAAALAGAREMFDGPVLTFFQPHLYSRTRDCAEDFGRVFANGADETVLVDVYPAREAPLPGVDSTLVVEAIRRHGGYVDGPVPVGAVLAALRARIQTDPYAAVLLMGAGDIGKVADAVAADVS